MASLAHALGAKEWSAEGAAKALEDLVRSIGLPTRLSEAGVKPEHTQQLVEKSLCDGCHTCNPRPCTAADMEAILQAAF